MTKTIPSDIRKAAKKLSREQGIPHQTALDVAARECGHSGWGAVLALKSKPLDPFRRLVRDLWDAGGTDLHIEPQMTFGGEEPRPTGAHVLFRIHGARRMISSLSVDEYETLKAAILPSMTGWDGILPTDGSVEMEIDGTRHVFQVASFPTNGDHKFAVRMPDRHVQSLSLEELGIDDLDGWMRICRSGPGLVIVSGTTNQGKSVTIARTLERLKAEGIDAIGEEDNLLFRDGRVQETLEAAMTRLVILEGYGRSLDKAIANAINMGMGNEQLGKVFRGGMHQELHRRPEGRRRLETAILPWNPS